METKNKQEKDEKKSHASVLLMWCDPDAAVQFDSDIHCSHQARSCIHVSEHNINENAKQLAVFTSSRSSE